MLTAVRGACDGVRRGEGLSSDRAIKGVLDTSVFGSSRARRGKSRRPLPTIQHGIDSGVSRVYEPVILPLVEAASNNCKVVDRGQDKGAMIRTSRVIRRAGGGRGWQWGQGRKSRWWRRVRPRGIT